MYITVAFLHTLIQKKKKNPKASKGLFMYNTAITTGNKIY